ncbi:hypothetical protein RI054_21g94290 [Pseudoscourfieldia marina]
MHYASSSSSSSSSSSHQKEEEENNLGKTYSSKRRRRRAAGLRALAPSGTHSEDEEMEENDIGSDDEVVENLEMTTTTATDDDEDDGDGEYAFHTPQGKQQVRERQLSSSVASSTSSNLAVGVACLYRYFVPRTLRDAVAATQKASAASRDAAELAHDVVSDLKSYIDGHGDEREVPTRLRRTMLLLATPEAQKAVYSFANAATAGVAQAAKEALPPAHVVSDALLSDRAAQVYARVVERAVHSFVDAVHRRMESGVGGGEGPSWIETVFRLLTAEQGARVVVAACKATAGAAVTAYVEKVHGNGYVELVEAITAPGRQKAVEELLSAVCASALSAMFTTDGDSAPRSPDSPRAVLPPLVAATPATPSTPGAAAVGALGDAAKGVMREVLRAGPEGRALVSAVAAASTGAAIQSALAPMGAYKARAEYALLALAMAVLATIVRSYVFVGSVVAVT